MFKNEANLEIILENKRIVDSIYKLVLFLDKKCSSLEIDFGDEYRQTMHLFIQSIVEYGKEAYNCMKRGDFYALSMLTRVIVENYTILVTIGNHCDEELYKYWTIWSYANTAEKYIKGSKNCNRITMLLMDCIEESGFSAELINDKNFLSDYGWTIGLKTSRYQLSSDINENINYDYKKLNEFVHGTSLLQKIGTFTFESTPLYVIFTMFTYLVKASEYYFDEDLDELYYYLVGNIYRLFDQVLKDLG